jgi:Tn3 transposase DDE domain
MAIRQQARSNAKRSADTDRTSVRDARRILIVAVPPVRALDVFGPAEVFGDANRLRAISYVNSGKFRVKTEAEQQIWNECSRLIANAIIYYNTLLLLRVYEQKFAADDQEAIKILRGTLPVAWRHVNLIGNFDFAARTSQVDIEALAARYNDPDFWRRSMQESDDGPAE